MLQEKDKSSKFIVQFISVGRKFVIYTEIIDTMNKNISPCKF